MLGVTLSKITKDKIQIATTGENNPRALLTWKEVTQIREYINNKTYSIKQLSSIYNVSKSTILAIKHNRIWKLE